MNRQYVTSKQLQKELDFTSYDVYQYLRRGLPNVQANPMVYDLEEVRTWISGFGEREAQRETVKKKVQDQLTDEEVHIITNPTWNAQYAVVWGMTSKRRALTMQRAIYLVVQYSTSRADNIVYLSRTTEQGDGVQAEFEKQLGELAYGFQALTMDELAGRILTKEQITFNPAEASTRILQAIQLLEDKPALQEKYGYIYRKLIVEEFEMFNASERRLLQLLLNVYGECMVNIDQEALERNTVLSEWINNMNLQVYNYFEG